MGSDYRMTENEVIEKLIAFLEKESWLVGENYCLGSKHGIDIKAEKAGKILIIEEKGAAASKDASNKAREYFDAGQIKTHFGKAIVQVLQYKAENPDCQYAIAHPDDELIKKHIGKLIPFLKHLNIIHFWVSPDGKVTNS